MIPSPPAVVEALAAFRIRGATYPHVPEPQLLEAMQDALERAIAIDKLEPLLSVKDMLNLIESSGPDARLVAAIAAGIYCTHQVTQQPLLFSDAVTLAISFLDTARYKLTPSLEAPASEASHVS